MAGLVLLALALGGGRAEAQVPVPQRRPPARAGLPDSLQDTTRRKPGQALDTATAGRLGIPTAPTRSFAPDDSVLTSLKARPGYQSTRYRADSATVFIEGQRVLLEGQALTERQGAQLEADTIRYERDRLHARRERESAPVRPRPGPGGRRHPVRHLPAPRDRERRAHQLHRGLDRLVPPRKRRAGLELQPDLRRVQRDHELRPADAALPLQRQADEVGLEKRAGRAAGGAVRAGRPDPVAAVHLPGRAAGAPVGHSDAPVRAQRPGAPDAELQPPDHQHRLLLGAERLSGPHRAGSTGSPTGTCSTA